MLWRLREQERERERVLFGASATRVWAYGGCCCEEMNPFENNMAIRLLGRSIYRPAGTFLSMLQNFNRHCVKNKLRPAQNLLVLLLFAVTPIPPK